MKQNQQFVVDQVIEGLGIKTPIGKQAVKLAIENLALLDHKQQDYGRGNLDRFGSFGVLVRISDKVSRLENLAKSDRAPNNEAVMDTWLDAANYGLLGAIMHCQETIGQPAESNVERFGS